MAHSVYRLALVTIGLFHLQGAAAKECYTTKKGIKFDQRVGECELNLVQEESERRVLEKFFRINCYCDSGTHCAENLATFEKFINSRKEQNPVYQCLYNHMKEGTFLADKGKGATSSTMPTGEKLAEPKKPYLSEEAKEYLDGAIARNMFIMIFLAVVIGVSAFFTYGDDNSRCTGYHHCSYSHFRSGDYMYRFFIATIGLILLRGATAIKCYTTKKGIQVYGVCALTVDYRDGSKCDIDDFELWGGTRKNQHMGNCGMTPKERKEKGKTVKFWRINCYCDSGTHCAEFFSTFKDFLDKNRGKTTLYQCLYDQLKAGMFLSDKGLLSTSSVRSEAFFSTSTVPPAESIKPVPRRKRPYLSEKAKEYLDGAIARNMFIMIFLAIVIGVSAYLTYGNDVSIHSLACDPYSTA
ncbi:hypothetical protein GCK32_004909 [Trichostrongylus colubriformis]|uniref:Uncharacterized protein n=1 Tax=Trichostrongylus colubriformis TaxID=6319 RepID=A0AAN8FA92_TRICO